MGLKTEIFSLSERERVLQAVTELCAEQGYQSTTAKQIVERAGVSREKFDEMFGGKEECLLAALNSIIGEVLSAVSSAYSADRSELESGLFGIKALLELMAANPSFAQLGFITCRQMGPADARHAQESGSRLLTAMIERLWEYSSGGVQPARAARAALGGAEAVVRREIVAGRTDQLPQLLPDFTYGVTVPFLGQEEALRLSKRARKLLRGTAWE